MTPKRIVYYSIGNHSVQLVVLYLQKLQHNFVNFNFIKQLLFINKGIGFLLVICRSTVCSDRFVTLRLFFAFIHFNHKSREQSHARPNH